MGFSNRQICVLFGNEECQVDSEQLQQAISHFIIAGIKPFLLVTTCGTTSTGSIDPLNELAAISKTHQMWLHIITSCPHALIHDNGL